MALTETLIRSSRKFIRSFVPGSEYLRLSEWQASNMLDSHSPKGVVEMNKDLSRKEIWATYRTAAIIGILGVAAAAFPPLALPSLALVLAKGVEGTYVLVKGGRMRQRIR